MISLKEIFTLLATGEFSNLSLQRDNQGNLKESEYEKVIGHINLGLVELYKRFRLLEEEIVLHAYPQVGTYHLDPSRMARPHNISPTTYLELPDHGDSSINLIEIKEVFDESGVSMRLNNRMALPSIRQVGEATLKIAGLQLPQKFTVVYQAHPSKIVLDDSLVPEECFLAIPQTIVEPLLYYVAFRTYKPLGANNSTANASKSADYQQQYELACQRLVLLGLDIENGDSRDTFAEDGWV